MLYIKLKGKALSISVHVKCFVVSRVLKFLEWRPRLSELHEEAPSCILCRAVGA